MIKWNYATKKNRVLPWPMPFTSTWQLWSTLYVVVQKKNCMAHLQTPALDNGVYIALYPKLKSSPSRYIKLNKLAANVQNLCLTSAHAYDNLICIMQNFTQGKCSLVVVFTSGRFRGNPVNAVKDSSRWDEHASKVVWSFVPSRFRSCTVKGSESAKSDTKVSASPGGRNSPDLLPVVKFMN